MRTFLILTLLFAPALLSILNTGVRNLGIEYETFIEMPKLKPEQIRVLVQAYRSVLEMVVLHSAPLGTDLSHRETMNRILVETKTETKEPTAMQKVTTKVKELEVQIDKSLTASKAVGDDVVKAKGYVTKITQGMADMVKNAAKAAISGGLKSLGFGRMLAGLRNIDNSSLYSNLYLDDEFRLFTKSKFSEVLWIF